MTEKELIEIENQLQIKLPTYYKDFQLNYPQELIDLKFNEEFLSNHAEWLIKVNRLLSGGGLPHEYFVIGMGGDFYFIKRDENDQSVYSVDHEEASESEDGGANWIDLMELQHKNLFDYKNWLIDFFGDYIVDQY